MTQTIEVIVSPTGETRVQTKGFAGATCRQASQFLEQALGITTHEKLTAEFHQRQSSGNVIREGQAISLATDRRFLTRALDLGFSRFHIFGPDKPVLCQDDRRTLFWAILDAGGVVPGSGNITRVSSPIAGQITRAEAELPDRIRGRARSPHLHASQSRSAPEIPVLRQRFQQPSTSPTGPSRPVLVPAGLDLRPVRLSGDVLCGVGWLSYRKPGLRWAKGSQLRVGSCLAISD